MQTRQNETEIKWLTEESLAHLNKGYLLKGETPYMAMQRIAKAGADKFIGTKYEAEAYEKFLWLITSGYLGLSSPVWSNMGTKRGLPISCFNVHVPDSIEGITDKLSEVITQTKIGGGTSGYFGDIRARGELIQDGENGKTSGAVSFMQLFDTTMNVVSQGSTRRGSFAAYLPIEHKDVEEFLNIKDIGSPIQNLFFAVTVTDEFMEGMIAGDVDKRKIWARVLESRQQKGLPYIFFTDTANENKPQIYKDIKAYINASNLCSEIFLPSNELESFVCCLASMNLELYDEWKDTPAVFWAVLFLDAVLTEFIEKTEGIKFMEASRRFAMNHRAIGLGVLGYHSYLQKNGWAFESFDASMANARIFKNIQKQSYKASEEIGDELGYAPVFGYDGVTERPRRHTTLNAVAPTTSNSAILGQLSPGIEPYASNYYKAGLAKGNFMRKNKYLQKLLADKGLDTPEVWQGIMLRDGSVQHMDELTPDEKAVFKTFKEISPMEIVTQSGQRQRYIDQGQSINLQIPSTMPVKDVNYLYIEAWKKGVKSLYYQRSSSVAKELMVNFVNCSSCEA